MLATGLAYMVLWMLGPADCATVGVRPDNWTGAGVQIDATAGCPLRTGDLVTAVDGRPLAGTAEPAAGTAGETVEYTVVRNDRESTVPVTLGRPDLPGVLGAAWPTLLFVLSMLAVAGYVNLRRPSPATTGLLIFSAGLAASVLPTLLGLPVIGVLDPWQRWLYLFLTQAVYLVGWSGGLAFVLQFPRTYPRVANWPARGRLALVSAPLWGVAAWGVASVPMSANFVDWTGRLIGGTSLAVIAALLAMIGVAVSRLRAGGDALERQQMRWLIGPGILSASAGLAGWFLPEALLGEGLPTGWIGLAVLPFVVGLGVALLRYRLFDLDIVLNRGLVYGLLTAGIVTVYIVVVAAAAAVMHGDTTTPASIVATVVVAVAVNPLRMLLQRGVDRMMYGDRDDPYSALSRLDRRLDDAGDSDRVLAAVADDIADALRVPYVALEIDPLQRVVEAGSRPRWLTDAELVEQPLADRGERLGRLLVAPRAPKAPFSPADRRLIDDLSLRVSAAGREISLRADLQRSREQLVLAREEERRRLRRALHDELGPAIAGIGLRMEAARRVVTTDPQEASTTLSVVRDSAQSLVADIRRLAYDLRPPALDDLGLAGALEQHARGIEHPAVTVTQSTDLGELPAAVEAAAYRIAVEAVTNTVRHANAEQCTIALTARNGALEVRVADDGRGVPADVRVGVGIAAMRERAAELGGSLRVERAPAGGGTVVVAKLPIGGDGQ
jgi:signal transduction histidine kinase